MSPTLAMLSLGSGAFGVTTSLLLIAFVMTMWVLALIILHPVHMLPVGMQHAMLGNTPKPLTFLKSMKNRCMNKLRERIKLALGLLN